MAESFSTDARLRIGVVGAPQVVLASDTVPAKPQTAELEILVARNALYPDERVTVISAVARGQ